MKTAFRQSFARDLKKVKDKTFLKRISQVIKGVEAAADLSAIADLKKLSGTDDCYRIRMGDYRIGVVIDGGIVEFARCLSRRDLYRFFP